MKSELILAGLALVTAWTTTAVADEIITEGRRYTIIKPRESAPKAALPMAKEPITASRSSVMPTTTPVPRLPPVPTQRLPKADCADGSTCDPQPNAVLPLPSSNAGR